MLGGAKLKFEPLLQTVILVPPQKRPNENTVPQYILVFIPFHFQLRKPNLPFTKEEEHFLTKGVSKLGRRWKHILSAYPFQEGRTAMSLKDKYRLRTRRGK